MKLTILAASVFTLLAVSVAGAERASGPCKADAEKFCKDVKPGGGRIMACLKEHAAELSAECRAKGLEVREKAKEMSEACKGDLDKLCKDVKGGRGEKLRCLKKHETELSGGCRAELDKRREELKQRHPCYKDMEKLCKDAKHGEGGMIACLKAHETELSAECKAKQAEKKENREERKKEKRAQRGEGKGELEVKQEPAAKPE